MGPFLVGIVTQITGQSNKGIISLIVLFIIGGFILTRVKEEEEETIEVPELVSERI